MPATATVPEDSDVDDDTAEPAASAVRVSPASDPRLRAILDEHFEFVWRSVRRLGVREADVDDAVQQVRIVVARKLALIAPGSERAFLFGAVLRVASTARRSVRRRGEVGESDPDQADEGPSAEELMDQRRARVLLDEVLSALPMDVRAVFVLFELEELTLAEIAELCGIPPGTAASRLRRGRELFEAEVVRVKARAVARVRR